MILLRVLILKRMTENVRIFARHISGKNNKFSDWLSRGLIDKFRNESNGRFEEQPTEIPKEIWPMSKIWVRN